MNLYLDNGDGTYTYYIHYENGTSQAIVVRRLEDIPTDYKEGTFCIEELI